MILMQIDSATRLGRSILGINIQYYSHEEKKIVIRTIGMIEMKVRHTASNISLLISNVLDSFGIDKCSISSLTCDNGANIIKSAKFFQEHQNSLLLGDQIEELQQRLLEESEDEDSDEFDQNGPLDVPLRVKEAISDITSIAVLLCCSIHTLQLSVHDALKDIKGKYGNEIGDIRKVMKNL